MAEFSSDHAGTGSRRGQYMALAAALLGWMFDGAEMGLFAMVGRSALMDLLGTSDTGIIGRWYGVVTALFLVGAALGGVLFGWLGDRIGRVRAMTLSVLTYAVFTGLCGMAGEAWQVGVFRFIASLGMGGEWSLGVALVMEVWPNRSRAFMAGLIGAAANVGYLIVGVVGFFLATILLQVEGWLSNAGFSEATVEMLVRNQGWRLLMMMGTLPALLTFFIRMFVPESRRWEEERDRGGTSAWATKDLLGVVLGSLGPAAIIYLWSRTGDDQPSGAVLLVGTVLGLLTATVGYLYPVWRFMQREIRDQGADPAGIRPTIQRMLLAAALASVALLGTWGSVQWAPTWVHELSEGDSNAKYAKEFTQMAMAAGAVLGTIVAAMMGDWIGRRATYVLMCLTSLASVFYFYQFNERYSPHFLVTVFIAGACTASFYGWLPLYLPELFRTSMRATGQGFSFNFGRIIAAVGALQTGSLTEIFKETDFRVAGHSLGTGLPAAGTVMSAIYLVGLVLIFFVPETRGKPLPD
jgi:MFS family permease